MINEWLRNDRERKREKSGKKAEALDEATEVIFERERDGQNE